MKKLLFNLPISLLLLLLFSFTFSDTKTLELKKETAEVFMIEGKYVFILSEPVMEYEDLGKVERGLVLSLEQSPGDRINDLVKKTDRIYPHAEGIIISQMDMTSAHAIRFKE